MFGFRFGFAKKFLFPCLDSFVRTGMKFRLVGNQDCPDWILAEVASLSKISSVKVRLLAAQVANFIVQKGKNDKDARSAIDFNKLYKIASDSKMANEDMEAVFACVNFIFSSAVKYNVDSSVLNDELQQLGMPKENCGSIVKVYQSRFAEMLKAFEELSSSAHQFGQVMFDSFQSPPSNDLSSSCYSFQSPRFEWKLDYVLSSSVVNNIRAHEFKLRVIHSTGDEQDRALVASMNRVQFETILAELKRARDIM